MVHLGVREELVIDEAALLLINGPPALDGLLESRHERLKAWIEPQADEGEDNGSVEGFERHMRIKGRDHGSSFGRGDRESA